MSNSDSSDGDIDAFDLGEFIDEHSELFLVMGVFGALAIYISQSSTGNTPDSEVFIRIGYVSAFGLSLLMFGLIYKKLIDEFGGLKTFLRAHFRLRNATLTVFSLFSVALIFSISYVLTWYEPVIIVLLLVLTLWLGIGAPLRILFAVDRLVPKTMVWRTSALFLTSLGLVLLAEHLRMRVLGQYQTKPIQQLSLFDPVPVVISVVSLFALMVAVTAGIVAMSLAAFGLPLILVDDLRKSLYKMLYGKTR